MGRASILMLAILLGSMIASRAFFENDFQFITFKMMKCKVEEKFIYQNVSCYVKSFNRSYSTFSIRGVAKVPVNDIFVSILSYHLHYSNQPSSHKKDIVAYFILLFMTTFYRSMQAFCTNME